jgi:hypothetical protein
VKHSQPEGTYVGMLKILSNKRNAGTTTSFCLCVPLDVSESLKL